MTLIFLPAVSFGNKDAGACAAVSPTAVSFGNKDAGALVFLNTERPVFKKSPSISLKLSKDENFFFKNFEKVLSISYAIREQPDWSIIELMAPNPGPISMTVSFSSKSSVAANFLAIFESIRKFCPNLFNGDIFSCSRIFFTSDRFIKKIVFSIEYIVLSIE